MTNPEPAPALVEPGHQSIGAKAALIKGVADLLADAFKQGYRTALDVLTTASSDATKSGQPQAAASYTLAADLLQKNQP